MAGPKKRTDRQLIWRVLHDAYENVESLIDAYHDIPTEPVVINCYQLLDEINNYAVRKYGKAVSVSRAEPFKDLKPIPLLMLPIPTKKSNDAK